MARIDLVNLKATVEKNHDPFDFYLFLTLNNGGEVDDGNPFSEDLVFLKTLLKHFEAGEEYEKCCEVRRRIKELV